MPKFKCHGQTIQAPSFDAAYAIRFNVSIAEAIADRGEPMTQDELSIRFKEAAGRLPTEAEMSTMHPESKSSVSEFYRS